MECSVVEKLTKKLEPVKVGDVVSVQDRTENYNVFLLSLEEFNEKRYHYNGRSVPENGARCCLLLFFLLLYDGSQGKSEECWSCPDARVWASTMDNCLLQKEVGVNSRIIQFELKIGEIVALGVMLWEDH